MAGLAAGLLLALPGGTGAATFELTDVVLALNAGNTANQGSAAAGNLTSINQPNGGGGNPLGATG